jgi:hypothetical protein
VSRRTGVQARHDEAVRRRTVPAAVARLLRGLGAPAPDPRLLGWLLVAGYLLQVALRLAISAGRDGPTNFADETGYLANARVMSGGVAGELSLAGFYRGGYSLLLLPAYWLGEGPRAEYRDVLATNALLSGLAFPLVHVLLTRAFRVPPRSALAAAFLAALYPPLVVTTQFAWAESLLPLLVLLAAITLAAAVTAPRRRAAAGWAVACGGCAGVLFTTHGRTVPLVVALLGLLLVGAWRRRDRAAAAAGAAAAVVVTAAGQLLNNWLSAASWGQARDDDLRRVLDNARDLGSLENVAALGAGQYWYLFVATFGLVVLGLVHLAGCLRPPVAATGRGLAGEDAGTDAAGPRPAGPARRPSPERDAGSPDAGAWVVSAFLLSSAVGLAVLVGLFLRPPLRPDHVVYGRYVEILVPPVLALGLVRLWTAPARRLLLELAAGAVLAAAAGVVVTVYAGGLVGRSPVNWYTVLALPPLAQAREQIRPAAAMLVALAGAGVLLLLAWRSRPWRVLGALGLAGVLVASSVALRVVLVEARDDAIYGTQPAALAAVPGLGAAREVSYDVAAYTPVGLYGYQWQLDRAHFVLFDSRRDPVPRTEWVIAGLDWPQGRQAGASRVWVHPAYRQAVWRLP